LLPCAGSRTGAVRHGLRPVLRVCTAGPLAGRLDSRWLSRGSFSPQHIRRDRSSASALRPRLAPPFGFDHPFDGLIPTVPCGRRRNLPQRSRDSPFGACPRPDRYRFPGPCPLAVPWWRSKRPLRVRFKALIPGRSSSRSWIDLPELPWVFPLGPSRSPPWLTVRYPGPSSSALCVLPPCGLQHPAPWSLAQRRARLAVSGCQPSWVFRPCGHAGSSPTSRSAEANQPLSRALFPFSTCRIGGSDVPRDPSPVRSAPRVWLPSRRLDPRTILVGSVSRRQRSWDSSALRSFLLSQGYPSVSAGWTRMPFFRRACSRSRRAGARGRSFRALTPCESSSRSAAC
jgi:hypothetical protein